jgi:hypothetical protein
MTPEKALALASIRVLYLSGMLKMPLAVQTHLRLCHNDPSDCLLCKMTQLQIESLHASAKPPEPA